MWARAVTGALAACLALAGPALADEGSLYDRLTEARQAEYSGEQLVVCWTAQGEVAAMYLVQQGGDALLVDHEGTRVMVAKGEYVERASGGWRTLKMAGGSYAGLHPRYRVEVGARHSHLGRSVDPVEVWEGELLRVRFLFDRQTSVPLVTKVFDARGAPFRMSSFTVFRAQAPRLFVPPEMNEMVVPAAQPVTLPEEAAGYALAGSYQGPHDGVHAYYGDGLFGFSVFEVPGALDPRQVPEAVPTEISGATYLVKVTPGEMWVFWSGRQRAYVLVGDLPPDHLERVLAELPAPRREGILSRLRRMLGR